MTRRSLFTLCTAAGLTGLYGLYSAVVSPFVVPGGDEGLGVARPAAAPPPPPENVRMAELYLPTQAWAAKAKYQVRTPEAFIYANEWEPVEEDQAVRFRPFALIYMPIDRKSDEQPITVIGESAYVKFARKFQISNPDPGRVIAGALQGNVRITGPDNLVIVGRNFIFTEKSMSLWSDESVHFAWGPHRGRGNGLQVELIADESATQHASIAVTGVQSLRLRRNVAVDLAFGDDARTPGRPQRPEGANDPTENVANPDKPKRDTNEVRVRSAGTFEFDVEANVATFSDNVRAYRPTGPDKYDSLQCDKLTLLLEPEEVVQAAARAAATPPPNSNTDTIPEAPKNPDTPEEAHRAVKDGHREGNFRNLNTRMTLRRVRARGKQVVLISESNDLTAHMTDLIYDVATRVASLTNPEQVRVTQGSSEIRSPGLTLVHDADGKLTSVWCQGPGWLKHYDPDSRALQLAAQWMHQLRRFNDQETGLDVIELEKQALVRQPEQKMGLAAEFIRLWMQPQQVRAARAGRSGGNSPNRMRLERMVAVNEVALVSPEMNGETDRLDVAFESAPPEAFPPRSNRRKRNGAPNAAPAADSNETSLLRRRADLKLVNFEAEGTEGNESRKPDGPLAPDPRSQPRSPEPTTAADSAPSEIPLTLDRAKPVPTRRTADPRRSSRNADAPASAEIPRRDGNAARKLTEGPSEENPIQVLADKIRVRVLISPDQKQTHVAEVWTEGNVEVTQEHEDGEEPLTVTGDRMHVENRSDVDQVLHVAGAPAHVRDRGIHIEGRNVHLDRAKNQSWVDGAGLLQLPVNSTLEGEKLDSPQLLDVWWKEKMTFDGESARFFGDVRSVLNDSRMLCQDMQVRLTQRIRFTERSAGRQVKVQSVDCRDGVEFESTQYAANKLIEVRRGQVAQFTLDQLTGKTTANGPGWMTFWRRGGGRRAGLGPAPAGTVAARATPSDSSQWEYTRVDFAGQSDGNVQQRFTTFEERVSIVYGPVERPLTVIDPDALPKDGGWMRCDKLRLQQHVLNASGPDKTPKTTHVEVLGSGNAELEGRTFHARADTISFDESKGLYVLRSLGNSKATIWRQKQVGGEYSRADAQRMEFVPSRNQLKLDQAISLDASP